MMKLDKKKIAGPPRILMLSWEFPPRIVGGLARHVGELSLALAQAGAEVDVVTTYVSSAPATEQLYPKRGKATAGRLTVHRAAADPINPIDFIASIHQLNFGLLARVMALGRDFDLVHGHDWLVSQASWVVKQGLQIPLISTIHATEHGRQQGINNPLQSYIHASEWHLTYESWRVICCSQFMAEEVKHALSVPADKIAVIPNGVDISRIAVSPKEKAGLKEFRTRWAAPDEKLILFVGRMVKEKGAHILIEAAFRVLSAWPKAKFVIAGGGFAGHLTERARILGIKDRVNFPGFVSEEDLRKLYAIADVAVFPSLYEPFGIVALEALATETPVVTSDIGGLKEVVRHGENGLHTWANNPDSLAWGILEVLKNPKAALERTRRGYQEVKTKFTWEKIAQQALAVYDDVLQEYRRRTKKQ